MKWLLVFWAVPVTFLGGWYTLSYYDMNFGLQFLSRDMHDVVFMVYGNILGVDPAVVPGMVFKAILVDTAIVFGLVFLRYKGLTLASWVKGLFTRNRQPTSTGSAAAPE